MIRRSINNIVVIALLMVFQKLSGQAVSSFNKLEVTDTSNNYSFIVSGHFYGSSTNASTFPASSLQANIDTLNSLNSSFLMSLGDLFVDVNEMYISHYQKSLFDKLTMPLFNAVGNHDLSNGNMYEKVYGKSFFSFSKGKELFIVLNTEINDGNIKDEQLTFLNDALEKTELCKNIFIFSHRPIWAENNERYKKLFVGNTRAMFGKNNFEEVVRPLLLKYSKNKKIYWMSGSTGGGPASFFYDFEPETSITFMQTAIRDQEKDAALLVNINNGNVSFSGISFSGQKVDKIENYGIDYWLGTKPADETFNFRLLPYLILKMITHNYFLIGLFLGLFIMLLIMWIRNRKLKRRRI